MSVIQGPLVFNKQVPLVCSEVLWNPSPKQDASVLAPISSTQVTIIISSMTPGDS